MRPCYELRIYNFAENRLYDQSEIGLYPFRDQCLPVLLRYTGYASRADPRPLSTSPGSQVKMPNQKAASGQRAVTTCRLSGVHGAGESEFVTSVLIVEPGGSRTNPLSAFVANGRGVSKDTPSGC